MLFIKPSPARWQHSRDAGDIGLLGRVQDAGQLAPLVLTVVLSRVKLPAEGRHKVAVVTVL